MRHRPVDEGKGFSLHKAGGGASLEALSDLLRAAPRWFVLTGAGCSTEVGIPDYRDRSGAWKRTQPVQYREFMHSDLARKRYWARSMVGWVPFSRAHPGTTHRALNALEAAGRIHRLVTQNVDRLHQRAGSTRVVDLHGNLEQVDCTACGAGISRAQMQVRLEAVNPHWHFEHAGLGPDGDVDLEGADYQGFEVPACSVCAGVLKPRVVFFGETVPRDRVEACYRSLAESDALLVLGSSLMVYSGFRFVKAAAARCIPVAIVNLGCTRGDELADVKVSAPCADALLDLCARLDVPSGGET